ncbi:hypothetical protein G7Z17_g4717 [Cylindrodendrum hubeiense]|uniref:Uncharacterized protein n=1 Tax=Cylindrodendrum hubeiense TaxID=595255 RepID=A0A9P5LCE0_9HYPO|nr:hypothetical protein G7Z17_g4717 [Cylindrodendrum hubeiense]
MPHLHLKLEDEGAPSYGGKVVAILNSALAPNRPKSPSDAATDLDLLFNQDYAEHGTADSFLWWFWDLVHDLARQVPYNSPEQDRLAAIVHELHRLPSKTVRVGEEWGSGGFIQLWTNLPMFGSTFYEKLDADPRATGETQKKERAVNLQAYAARIGGLGIIPFEMYAIWALVSALEGTMTPIRGAPDEVNYDATTVEDITYKVKSAATWMKHAGHLLYGRDETVHGATAGPLWRLSKNETIKLKRRHKGTDGLCPQRWQLWKERFRAIRDTDGLDGDIRKEAGDAYTAMNKIEEGQNL